MGRRIRQVGAGRRQHQQYKNPEAWRRQLAQYLWEGGGTLARVTRRTRSTITDHGLAGARTGQRQDKKGSAMREATNIDAAVRASKMGEATSGVPPSVDRRALRRQRTH